MTNKQIQDKIDKVFHENFGYTSLNERLNDIQGEFLELIKWTDIRNLKEEAGDLLCSLIQLHSENDWDFEETILKSLNKIESRKLQYKTLGRKTKVAIYGGAFDPITIGHIQAAKFVLNTSKQFDEVWIMPAFKHMYGKEMTDFLHRLEMCKLAAKEDKRIKIFDYEIKNELAGETFYFVKKLKEEKELNEKYNFSIIIGLDNALTFDKWVNYELLERLIRFVVIPRKGYDIVDHNAWFFKDPHIFLNQENTIMEVSSTQVRQILHDKMLTENTERELLTTICPDVYKYITENNLYERK